MTLLGQIGQLVGKAVVPIKYSGIVEVSIPEIDKTEIEEFRLPGFSRPSVFRIPKGIIQNAEPSPNLLLSLSEIKIESRFAVLPLPSITEDLAGIISFVAQTRISENLLVPLRAESLNGKAYAEQRTKDEKQASLFADFQPVASRSDFKKAYTRVKTPNSISSHATLKLSIWDLIYPMLLPPLSFDFVPQFDSLERLRPYQMTGISFLLENDTALLADEMGTGKTVMTVVALRLLFRQGRAKRVLIICPVSVLRVWQDHLLEWASELEFTVVRGTKETRKLDWKYPAHIFLTTYETVVSDFLTLVKRKTTFSCPNCGAPLHFKEKIHLESEDVLPEFECPRCRSSLNNIPVRSSLVDPAILNSFDLVVLDEAQYIKNPTSDRSRAVKMMKARIRWALTGTPLENRLDDLVSIFEFLRPNYLRIEGLTPHRAATIIRPYFLRRLKEDVIDDLPPKIKQDKWLELDEDQRREYDAALKGGVSELQGLGGKVSKVHIFSLLTKLKRICNFAKNSDSSSKTKALVELVEEIVASGHKVLVFSQYKDHYGVEGLESTLRPFGVVTMKGGMTDGARAVAEDTFKRDLDIPVFLSTVKTGGVGLTLTEASYVIHFDHWWNPATMWQAEDRAHRYGQKRGVNVYSFWMQNTIEEKVYDTLRKKGLLFEEVVNGLSEEAVDNMISTDDWLEMLGVKRAEDKKARRDKLEQPSRSVDEVLDSLFALSPIEFEEIVKVVFSKIGFTNVRTTKRSHDGGIDLVGYRRSVGGAEKVIAQCKRVERVGVEIARELLGVIAADQSISKAFLVTSGSVSPDCRAFCERDGRLSVIEGPTLANYVLQFEIALGH